MTHPEMPPVFDGHNDLLLNLYRKGGPSAAPLFAQGREGHLDLPKAKRGGFGGGFFAVFVPSPLDRSERVEAMQAERYDLPLPDPIAWEDALPVALSQVATLLKLEETGALKICHTADDIRGALASGKVAAVMHMEGAEAIDPDFHTLDVLYAAGLRSLGPVWSRPNIYGHGVPFRFPSTGDTGPGLSDHGLRLLARCNELGILFDLSHLNEAGFWDAARHSTAPLVATHSNAHAITPISRNLTDAQLKAIRDSNGMVGLNFAVAFLREDGRQVAETPIAQMLRHLDHLIEKLGEDRVGFGSDFDGATVPEEIGDCAGLPNLRQAMAENGYGPELIDKLCNKNWIRVLEATWSS
ncbi:dipeptidase [Aliiruegeria sabulilitoris]|uniref:dipeptidase n=1 Tax=Aliiruegeria sabulilitoris TaxID=1510458 RepID=UPI0008332FBA|nr:dipeptidase [Aliiruegeria sabulilitoris]NDR57351.1 membrane dipeptidase [Pseudoruegeria sp. M32A2M]